MALKVRTSHGKVFHRCGMRFDKTWKIVDDDVLGKLFASPGPAKKGKHPTVRQILTNDEMLICMEDDSPRRSKPNGSGKGGGGSKGSGAGSGDGGGGDSKDSGGGSGEENGKGNGK